MSGHRLELTRSSEIRHAAAVRHRLLEELHRTLDPLARLTPLALAYVTPARADWLTACDACPCSQHGGDAPPCFTSTVQGRYTCGVDVSLDGKHDGTAFLCCEATARFLEAALCRVVENVLQIAQLEKERDFLNAELGASRESLEAVYEISSNLRSLHNTDELLHRILARALALRPGLRVVLWVVNEDVLEPVAWKNTTPAEERPLSGGLVGKTLAHRTSILLNGRAKLATINDLEPELRDAVSAAVLPIATPQAVLGALEIWQDQEGEAAFDSRMLYLLETLALLAAMVVDNDRLHRTALQSERLRRDVEIGSRIQQTLLLGRAPLDLDLIRAAALSVPSQQIDGDFYDFVEHEQTLDVIVGDVMGKGIPAALVGAATKTHFLRAMNYLLGSNGGKLPEPREVLSIVNAELVKQLIGIESFITLVYARFDLKNQVLKLIDCGHTKTIHVSNQTGEYSLLQGSNMPLGFSQGEVYEPVSFPFGAGDVFLFYSDGITETKDAAGTFFGEERLAEVVRGNHFLDPKDLVETVRQEVLTFSESETFNDDLTCVAVKIQDMEATIPSKRAKLDFLSDLAELPRVRDFVREFTTKGHGLVFEEEDLHKLELAVTEAVTNIIRHGYQGQKDRPVRLQADLFLNRVTLRFFHRGVAFDPGLGAVPEIQGPQESGMGMYIIQQCVDKVRYYRSKHGENCIHLVKQLMPHFTGGSASGHHA